MSMPTDKLTAKGKIAKREGGHLKYLEWEKKENKKQKKLNIQQKYWLLFAVIAYIGGIFSPILTDIFRSIVLEKKSTQKISQDTTLSNKPIQAKVDTVYIYLPDSSLKYPNKKHK